MNFFLNGQSVNTPFTGIKGTVFPVFYGEFIQFDGELEMGPAQLCVKEVSNCVMFNILLHKSLWLAYQNSFDMLMALTELSIHT